MPVPLFLLLGAAAGVAVGVAVGRAGTGRRVPLQGVSAEPAKYGDGPDPESVRVGDDVVLEGHRCRVVATIGFGQEGERWTAACLEAGRSREWVSLVHRATGLEVCRWTKITVFPGGLEDPTITYEGRTYRRMEAGTARYDAHGDVPLARRGLVRYVDFADGDHRLSFENYDEEGWEISVGRVVAPGGFTAHP